MAAHKDAIGWWRSPMTKLRADEQAAAQRLTAAEPAKGSKSVLTSSGMHAQIVEASHRLLP